MDIVENILYISADEAKEIPEPSGDNVQNQNVASGNDAYAVVNKGDFPRNDTSVYAEVNKTKKKREHQDSFFLEFCGIFNIATSFFTKICPINDFKQNVHFKYACAMFLCQYFYMYLTLNLLYLYTVFFIYTFVPNVGHLFLFLQ